MLPTAVERRPSATWSATSIAVIGPVTSRFGESPIYLAAGRAGDRFEAGRPGRWETTTSGSTRFAILWIILISILFLAPSVPQGIPWNSSFDWKPRQLRTADGGWRLRPCSEGGGVVSAKELVSRARSARAPRPSSRRSRRGSRHLREAPVQGGPDARRARCGRWPANRARHP